MHIVARARAFVESLRAIARRTAVERRRCPACHSTHVHRHGTYTRQPYTLQGRLTWPCSATAARAATPPTPTRTRTSSPAPTTAAAYAAAPSTMWLHTGSSLRRVAEWLRSIIGHQERWWFWHLLGDVWGGEGAPRVVLAGTVYTIYRNFTPAQMRREHTRRHRHPGKSAREVAGVAIEGCGYLDALQV